VLRQFLRTADRGLITLVAEWQEFRKALSLTRLGSVGILRSAVATILTRIALAGLALGPR